MEYITPHNRSQIEFSSLDDLVEQDNQVRFIEAFLSAIAGVLAYNHNLFLKIFFVSVALLKYSQWLKHLSTQD